MVTVPQPGGVEAEATRVQGQFVRDVIRQNPDNFRVFSPDETSSNRWNAVFEASDRVFTGEIHPGDEHLSPDELDQLDAMLASARERSKKRRPKGGRK